jgi:choice-of-anchor B domain-containing protein
MSIRNSLVAFTGVAALSALAFAPIVSSTADLADGKARAAAAGILDVSDEMLASQLAVADDLELVDCVVGVAGPFYCDNVNLVDTVPTAGFGGGHGSDSWGWTDDDGTEYAIVTSGVGTGFFRLKANGTTEYLGSLERSQTRDSLLWNDPKVVNNHAYITSEDSSFGMQIVDLKAVATLTEIPLGTGAGVIEQAGFVTAGGGHNLVAFEERDIIAMTIAEDATCGGGIVFYDVQDTKETAPELLGCVGGSQDPWLTGLTHDAQCVTYFGPDVDYNGAGVDGQLDTDDDVAASDICLMFQEDSGVFVIDVSEITRDRKIDGRATMLTRFTYDTINYTHQGWFTEDQRWVLFNDELDESGAAATALGGRGSQNQFTTTYWVDLADLDVGAATARTGIPDVNEELVKSWSNMNTLAVDHNMYVVGNLLYQANYGAGLRVLEFSTESLESGEGFKEVAYFDTYPGPGASEFYGAWSVYPFFESGNIILSDFQSGLLVLDVTLDEG